MTEPMYDDMTLEAIKEQEMGKLIGALAEYCIKKFDILIGTPSE